MEVELKLLIDPENVTAFKNYLVSKKTMLSKPKLKQFSSTYFDTSDFYFRRNKSELRIREVGQGKWIQTMKAKGKFPKAGFYQREEWESPVKQNQPDLIALRKQIGKESDLAKLVSDAKLPEQLKAIFSTRVKRTVWTLRPPLGGEVELALDEGELTHENAHVPISEIELELKSGNPKLLFDLALELQNAVPVRLGNSSKSERGYALCVPELPGVLKARPVKLSPSQSVLEGFEAIISNCIQQIQGNENGVLQGDDPEYIHQMRVGVRRLRSALKLFEKVFPCPEELKTELEWLSTELGEVRNWEVLAGDTLNKIKDKTAPHQDLERLQQAAVEQAQTRRQAFVEIMSSSRYSALFLRLTQWMVEKMLDGQSETSVEEESMSSLAKFANDTLANFYKTLLKRGKHLKHSTPEARHRLRIAAKKTRYALEFFESLYPQKRNHRFLKSLSHLQEALGHLNDVITADKLLLSFTGDLAQVAGFARGYLSAESECDIRKMHKGWQRFALVKIPCVH